MPSRWPASIITKNPVTPTGPVATGSAPGIWRLDEVAYWSKQGLWPNTSISPDPYYSYVSMLLGTTAINNAQNNTFLDSSSNNFTITRNGNTTQGSFNPYGSLWSNYFGGGSIRLATPASSLFSATSYTNYTVEGWFFWENTNNTYPTFFEFYLGGRPDYWRVHPDITNSKKLTVWVQNYDFDPPYTAYQTNITVPQRQWFHLAIVKQGGTTKIYLNGVLGYTGSITYPPAGNYNVYVGGSFSSGDSNAYQGFASNFRVVPNTAVYTSNFTPSTAPLTAITNTALLTCQSNRLIDKSTNNFTLTPNGTVRVYDYTPFSPAYPGYSPSAGISSIAFDGATDWLNLGGQSAFAYGTGAFTIECWFYALGLGQMIIDGRPPYTNGNYVLVSVGGGGTLEYYSNNIGQVLGNTQIRLGTWNHFAIARSGTTTKMFLNGVENASFSDNTNYEAATDRPIIGTNGYRTDLSHFNGFMSNFRIVKGTAVYTSNFTPPTSPVTAISGTSLLINGTNAGVYDSVAINNFETLDNAKVSTAQSKFGGTSVSFIGGGYLDSSNTRAAIQGSMAYTLEAWIYPTTVAGDCCIYETRGGAGWVWFINGSGYLQVYDSVQAIQTASTTQLSANQWYHVALVRQAGSSTNTYYVNGNAAGTFTLSSFASATRIRIGARNDTAAMYYGYIDDLRVTLDVARYTANFTPPTAAFSTF